MAKATQTTVIVKWTLELSDEEAKCLRGILGGLSGSDFKSVSEGCYAKYSQYVDVTTAARVRVALDKAGI